jgi:hypothetical protein
VLIAEHSIPKKPDNLILMESCQLSAKASRAILGLRLCGDGSVGIGPMWVIRAARFNVGFGGISQVGASIPTMGTYFKWTPTIRANYSAIYDGVKQLEEKGFKASPGNLSVALGAFSSTYDRRPTAQQSQLLDCVTALEALLVADNEIAFKLSFRIASILAETDEERSDMLKLLKDFYDTRSKVIHGANLKERHQGLLGRVDELRSIVKRLLVAFIRLGKTKPPEYGKNFWEAKLDGVLVNTVEREKLRVALGLSLAHCGAVNAVNSKLMPRRYGHLTAYFLSTFIIALAAGHAVGRHRGQAAPHAGRRDGIERVDAARWRWRKACRTPCGRWAE